MPTIKPGPDIISAILLVHMSDGTTLRTEGKPTVDRFDVDISQDRIDFGAPPTRRFQLDPPRTEVSFAACWQQPTLTLLVEPTNWWGRFKRWLRTFPTS